MERKNNHAFIISKYLTKNQKKCSQRVNEIVQKPNSVLWLKNLFLTLKINIDAEV